MKIRFCENNKGTGKVFKKLKETYPDLNIKRKECLKNCGTCKKSPIALVDGKLVSAADSEELYRKIVAALGKT
ncbi:MAG TPA: DUF1450 domain-containing protein [Geobacteraceae bacterium]|nr:DUF1450 domain-containing protein [Geobacteraceae bacterium]